MDTERKFNICLIKVLEGIIRISERWLSLKRAEENSRIDERYQPTDSGSPTRLKWKWLKKEKKE